MKNLFIIMALAASLLLPSCTDNQRAKKYGGKQMIDLPEGTKLVNVTWKDEDMWVLTRPMHTGEYAEALTFQEKSSYGILEGKITFVEHSAKEAFNAQDWIDKHVMNYSDTTAMLDAYKLSIQEQDTAWSTKSK